MFINIIQKIRSLPNGVKASVSYFFAGLVTSGIAYITTPIFVDLLTTDEFGQTSNYLAWVHVLGIVAMFCLSYGVFNNGMLDYPERRDEYSFSMLGLSNVITIVFSIIVFLLFPVLNKFSKMDYPLVILMCVLFVFQPAYNMWYTKQRYEYKYKGVMLWSILSAVFSTFVALLCVLKQPYGNRLYARIFGSQLSLIAIYIGFYFYIAKNSHFRVKTHYWKSAVLFNLPLIPHYLSTYLLSSSDKIMITYLIGETANAYYSVAHSVAAVSLIVWTAVNSSLVPFTYQNCKKNDYKSINKVTLPILTVFAGICLIVIMLAPEVVLIMSNDKYMESVYVIPPLIGGLFFQVQYYIYANILYYYKKPKYVMFGSLIATSLNLILNYVFISKFGYIAAGYTTIFCYLIQAIIDYIGMKKVVKERVYNMKYISILSIVVILVSLISNLIYDIPFVRYLIILVSLTFIFIFRKKIIQIIVLLKQK